MSYRALRITRDDSGYRCQLQTLDDADLPAGEVTVRVDYSTLNYKDGLAITGKSPVVRQFPLTPGIDLAGVVEHSEDPRWTVGQAVLLNGWGVGETHSGGLAERARLRGDWLLAIPSAFDARQAMAIGTAGYTAMLCVMALEKHGVTPEQGEVLVTGAGGGVGSHTLANACASTRYGGTVAACGLAQGMDLPGSVAPFILRGVTLAGVDSVMAPRALREAAWARLARDLDVAKLDAMTQEVALADAIGLGAQILAGQVRGRVVVDVNR